MVLRRGSNKLGQTLNENYDTMMRIVNNTSPSLPIYIHTYNAYNILYDIPYTN